MDLYRGRRLSIERKTFSLPNGHVREKVVVHPGSASVILPLESDVCILIRQFRFVIGEYIFEAPAGTMNPGESPEETAHRELAEETGFAAGMLIPRGFIYSTPGFTDEKLYLFEARDLVPLQGHHLDEDEVIEIVRVEKREVLAMIKDGRISDAKTIAIVHRCLGC